MENDVYKTLSAPAEAIYKEKSSRFLAYAWPVKDADEVKGHVEALRKRYYDATHHCYAYRLGVDGALFRANDDGEPSGTAGRPILGQLISFGLTDCLIVVVRYFGGTKLGVPGLINAYKESARAVIENGEIVERTVDMELILSFDYNTMNDVMRIVKEEQPRILEQCFDNRCLLRVAIRKSRSEMLVARFDKIEGVEVNVTEQ